MKGIMGTVLFGKTYSGKTSLIKRYAKNKYKDKYVSTTEVKFKTYDFEFPSHREYVKLRDTAGAQRFFNKAKKYAKTDEIIILVYCVDDRRSFDEIKTFWFPEIIEECKEDGK